MLPTANRLSATLIVVLTCCLIGSAGEPRDALNRQLGGEVRQIRGDSRTGVGQEPPQGLPRQLSLAIQADRLVVGEAAGSDALLSVTRSYEGETLRLGVAPEPLSGSTRAIGGNAPPSETLPVASSPIGPEQLLGQSAFRGTSLVTPAAGSRLLSGTPTFRRASDDAGPLESAEVEVRRSGEAVLTFTFPANETQLSFQAIRRQNETAVEALQAGEYRLLINGKPAGSFLVEEEDLVEWVREPSIAMKALCDGQESTARIYEIHSLLAQLDENGSPSPYLCDALDLIERTKPLTPHTRDIRTRILRKLGQSSDPSTASAGVGITSIDRIRSHLSRGHWSKAKKESRAIIDSDESSARERSMAKLYLAVALGVSAEGLIDSKDRVRELFLEAIEELGQSNRADAFRAHNNFANYLVGKAQSRIYNHAVQAAAGVENPLLTSLWYWSRAQFHYLKAGELSDAVAPADKAALLLNQSRLYATLGDFCRNLDDSKEPLQRLLDFADSQTIEYATQAKVLPQAEPIVMASAAETLANAAYRRDEAEQTRRLLNEAMATYQAIGSLPGLVSCNRLLGLLAAKDNSRPEAVKHLKIAVALGELLREQVALSEAGQDRAGYFAKYAYTNERLIDLLLESGNDLSVLEVAERSKARAFEDLLAHRNASSAQENDDAFPTLDEAIETLDPDTVVIEYYVGADHVFCFVVHQGNVRAFRLKDGNGEALLASELISRVTGFLSRMERRARKMIVEARSPRGFDKNWQNELHQFYLELIPSKARQSLADAKHLVVVPHHVLHYFPFAALVTELDDQEVSRFQLPQPVFFVEAGFDITAAPSLRAFSYMKSENSIVSTANAIGISEFEGAPRLPGVEIDLANFTEVFSKALGDLLTARPITEAKIGAVMADESLLFVGTHGKNVADYPLSSFLLCDGDAESDGRLTAQEIFCADVGAQAIIMSACYSGLADRSPLPGDDLFGLQRAMLQGGSRSIVSGLWDVYDDTAPLLMRSTMQAFADGKEMRTSLANAQREFLADRKAKGPTDLWIHPYFWAVYNSTGSGHTTMRPR